MVSITKNRGNGKHKVMVTDNELKTINIALAVLSILDMEQEAQEQGLDVNELTYNHFSIFNTFCKATGLYPVPTEPSYRAEIDEAIIEKE